MSSKISLLSTIVENLNRPVYVVENNRLVFANKELANLMGYDSPDHMLDLDFFKEVYPDPETLEAFRSVNESVINDGLPRVSWGQPMRCSRFVVHWVEGEACPVPVGDSLGILGILKDVTECKRMAEAVLESQQLLNNILNAMEDRVYVVTQDYRLIFCNQKTRLAMGLAGNPCSCAVSNDVYCYKVLQGLDAPCIFCKNKQVFEENKPVVWEYFDQNLQGWFSVIEKPIVIPGEKRAKLVVTRDISRVKESEQRIRSLSREVKRAHWEERARISRNLHDDLGQQLNYLKIKLDLLSSAAQLSCTELAVDAHEISLIVADVIESTRNLAHGLRPEAMERFGLTDSISKALSVISKECSIETDFKAAGIEDVELDPDICIELYRIFQEAINNVIKHAHAKKVVIRLVRSYPHIIFKIQDDGRGFNLDEHLHGNSEGMGLSNISDRVVLLGGEMQIFSEPGNGTKLEIRIPYD